MREPRLRRAGNILTDSSTQSKCHVAKGVEVEHSETWCENGSKVKRQKHVGAQRPLWFLLGVLCLPPFFCPSPLPVGASTVLSLTRGPAGNRTATGNLSAPQEWCPTNFTTRMTGVLCLSPADHRPRCFWVCFFCCFVLVGSCTVAAQWIMYRSLFTHARTAVCSGDYQRGRPTTGIKQPTACHQLLLQLSNWHSLPLPSYRQRNWDCHQIFRKSVSQSLGHPRSSAPADQRPWQCYDNYINSVVPQIVARSLRATEEAAHAKPDFN